MTLGLIVVGEEKEWQNGVDETSMIGVGIAQEHLYMSRMHDHIKEARHAKGSGTGRGMKHYHVWTVKSQIPILLGTEDEKLNSNPRRENEGLISIINTLSSHSLVVQHSVP
ncbi:hypothetical protein HAX54_031980 [Datura stramonium]|uniref:Uncharacterized protein n=1 Tax=Datura stramonium TaxID=4076 RepID=A0ABS8SCD8_DATST|nr:hypothetical protein [Datura stramonium]